MLAVGLLREQPTTTVNCAVIVATTATRDIKSEAPWQVRCLVWILQEAMRRRSRRYGSRRRSGHRRLALATAAQKELPQSFSYVRLSSLTPLVVTWKGQAGKPDVQACPGDHYRKFSIIIRSDSALSTCDQAI
jgi:hypothetical protein